jgi:hypothetical protein
MEYCKKRAATASKYRFVNFWTFVQLDLTDGKWKQPSSIKKCIFCGHEFTPELTPQLCCSDDCFDMYHGLKKEKL